MQEFGISTNKLTGQIPSSLFMSRLKLISFQAQGNSFTWKIPPELGKATHLQVLYLYSNNLTGSIPVELGELVNLNQLDLSVNWLTGPIPISFWWSSGISGA